MEVTEPRQRVKLEGHLPAQKRFLVAYHSGKLHHSWLISGPKGIGKATLAFSMVRYIFAHNLVSSSETILEKTLLEPNSNSDRYPLWVDPALPEVAQISASSHADFVTIEKQIDEFGKGVSKEIKVRDVEAIRTFLQKTSANGGHRIVLIDSVDQMNNFAANALLKLIEEPPAKVLLLLISHNPNSLLPTLRSRCINLRLRSLNKSDLLKVVGDFSDTDNLEVDDHVINMFDGSAGKALSFLENGGLHLNSLVKKLLSNLPESDASLTNTIADLVARDRDKKAPEMLRELLEVWLIEMARRSVIEDSIKDYRTNRWVQTWERMNSLFHSAESVNLDYRQVVFEIFDTIGSSVQQLNVADQSS